MGDKKEGDTVSKGHIGKEMALKLRDQPIYPGQAMEMAMQGFYPTNCLP